MIDPRDRAFLTRLFGTAVSAADPKAAMMSALPPRPIGRTVVIGVGKGAAQMAAAFEELSALLDQVLAGLRSTYASQGRAESSSSVSASATASAS